MNRRGLFALLGGLAVAPQELWTPSKSIFLPPRGGWVSQKVYNYLAIYGSDGREIARRAVESFWWDERENGERLMATFPPSEANGPWESWSILDRNGVPLNRKVEQLGHKMPPQTWQLTVLARRP